MFIRIVLTSLLIGFFTGLVCAEPVLSVHVERSVIYQGEAFLYQIIIEDAAPQDDSVLPDTSKWIDFDVQFLGKQLEQRGGSSFTMIINGQTIRDDRSEQTYRTHFNYILKPKRTGSLSIPFPNVSASGKQLQPQSFSVGEGPRNVSQDHSISVQVSAPEQQDAVFLAIETNRNRLYPLQPLELTLVVQIKALPGRYAATSPLSLLRQPPQLQIPWIAEEIKGFQSPQTLERWLNGLLVRSQQRGFAINGFASNRIGFDDDMFNFPFSASDFFQKVSLQFADTPRKIIRKDLQNNETEYWEYRFTRTLIPQEFGNYSFGPVTLKGAFPIGSGTDLSEEIVPKLFYAFAPAVTVTVTDVPQDNRPGDYIGAFGSFEWTADIVPKQARVGDPMTLTLSLTGKGSTLNVRPPDLSKIAEITENFRVHMPPTEEIDGQSCKFTYTIRPIKPGSITFPAINVSVFDVNMEQFAPLKNPPIPLIIAETETAQSATLFGNVPENEPQLAEGGLFANKTEIDGILPMLSFAHWAAVLLILSACYAAAVLAKSITRLKETSPLEQQRRKAWNRAKLRLENISAELNNPLSVDLLSISSGLQSVFFGYIADKSGLTEQGMTTNDACEQLRKSGKPQTLIEAIRSALESLDAVKYGGADIKSLDKTAKTTEELLQKLELEHS